MRAHDDWWTVALLGPGSRHTAEAAALRAAGTCELPGKAARLELCPRCDQVQWFGVHGPVNGLCADRLASGDRHGHALERVAQGRAGIGTRARRLSP